MVWIYINFRAIIPRNFLNGGTYKIVPHAHVFKKYWILENMNGLLINVLFDVPNPDYSYPEDKRPKGIIAPIIKWEVK